MRHINDMKTYRHRHTQATPKYDIGATVYCSDRRFPGPWIVEAQVPWNECGKGEWRYYCGRPEGFPRHIRRGGIVLEMRQQMVAFEWELFAKMKSFSFRRSPANGRIILP